LVLRGTNGESRSELARVSQNRMRVVTLPDRSTGESWRCAAEGQRFEAMEAVRDGPAPAEAGQPVTRAFVIGRWTMIIWPVGYLGLRLAAEYYVRRNRKVAVPS
jgi:hypothetical protein